MSAPSTHSLNSVEKYVRKSFKAGSFDPLPQPREFAFVTLDSTLWNDAEYHKTSVNVGVAETPKGAFITVLACVSLNGTVEFFLEDGTKLSTKARIHFKNPMPVQDEDTSRLIYQSSLALYVLVAAGHVGEFKESAGTSLVDLRAACVVSAKMWHKVVLVEEELVKDDVSMEEWTAVEYSEANGKAMNILLLLMTTCGWNCGYALPSL
jgi:hypothetical protein